MPRLKSTPLKALPPGVEQQVLAYGQNLQGGAAKRSAHLMVVGISCLKWLILKGESDALRFQAAKYLLELAPVQERLGAMSKAVAQHYHQHLHVEASPANRKLVSEFERLIADGQGETILGMIEAENPPETPENPS